MASKSINFFKGYASNFLAPRKQIESSYSKVLLGSDFDQFDTDPNNQHPLAYGTDPGNESTRAELSKFISRKFGVPAIDPDCFNLTNGASFGIGTILKRATHPDYTKKVFIVTPCYYLINFAFVDAGLGDKISAVNETPEGEYQIDIAQLEQELEKIALEPNDGILPDPTGRDHSKVYRAVLYIVPAFSNPGGLNYSLKTRLKLIELARKYDVLIVCDDVYDLLDYTGEPILPRIVHLDRETSTSEFGNVVSNSSTSKIISPGLRFGWHETTTPKLAFQFSQEGCVKSGGTPNQLSSFVIEDLVKTGTLDSIIENFVSHYSKRAKVMKEALKKYLPESTKFYGGDGGYFIWVVIDPKYDLLDIIARLKAEHNIVLASGTNFAVFKDHQNWSNCVRMCFSLLTAEEIEYGIKVFGSYFK